MNLFSHNLNLTLVKILASNMCRIYLVGYCEGGADLGHLKSEVKLETLNVKQELKIRVPSRDTSNID